MTKDEADEKVNYDFFYNEVWPALVGRVPSFKTAKVRASHEAPKVYVC